MLDTLSRVLRPAARTARVDDFAADYRRTVVNKLDRMELLGVTLADTNRRYPLSIAYIDLTVLKRTGKEDSRLVIRGDREASGSLTGAGGRGLVPPGGRYSSASPPTRTSRSR